MSTNKKEIIVSINNTDLTEAFALFAAPEGAEQHQDLLRMWCTDESLQGKFTLHTLAQQALLDFEDNELSVQWQPPDKAMKAAFGDETVVIASGIALAMDRNKQIHLYAHEGVPIVKLLRAIHRYATRMIRLDVR